MKKRNLLLVAIATLVFWMTATTSGAGVNVNINVPLPGLVISEPPDMAVMPGTSVYYPPEVSVDIFFYHGNWYRPHRQGWFVANGYNGPWRPIAVGRVPREVTSIPPGYRNVRPQYAHIAHDDMRRNWRAWERERHWDHDGRKGRDHEERRNDKRYKHGDDNHDDGGQHNRWGR